MQMSHQANGTNSGVRSTSIKYWDDYHGRGNRDVVAQRLTPDQLARGQDIAARCFESGYKDCD